MDDLIGTVAVRIHRELRYFTPDAQRQILKRVGELTRGYAPRPNGLPAAEAPSPVPAIGGGPVPQYDYGENPEPRERMTQEALADLAMRIVAFVLEKNGASSGTIALALDAKVTSVQLALRKLVKAGRIRMHGEKRSAVYLAPEVASGAEG